MWGYYIVLLCAVLPCWGRLAEEVVQAEDHCASANLHCYHKPLEACPSAKDNCRCKEDLCREAVICCDVDSFRLTEGLGCANLSLNRDNISAIHIRNATLDVLNFNDYKNWRRLRSMSITDGHIGSVSGEFGKLSGISCLNLSANGITKFMNRPLANLKQLSKLDVSHNNLSLVPRFKKEGNFTLDISDNRRMLCTSLYEAMNRQYLEFYNENKTWCLSANTFHWFNSTELIPLKHLERVREFRDYCIKNCSCEPQRLDIMPGKAPTFAAKVSCPSRQLTELPSPLPPNTIALNVSNNNITSLDAIREDPSYQNLRELYADNNQINSILPLEGTKFIAHFVALSLRNNKLKTIPTYVLSNIFDRTYVTHRISLGHNKLTCDCSTAKVFKVWLLTKQKYIPDYYDIECENMDQKVINLDPSKLCQSQHDWSDYIYYIITAEVLLLLFLILKVSYDYWVFKTAGYLPWPASKMPKLPCDWLCE